MLAEVTVGQDGDGSVLFGAGDAPGGLFGGDEASLGVAGVAVGGVAGGAELDEAVGWGPFPHVLSVGIGHDQISVIAAEPDRPLGPGQAAAQLRPGGGW